MLVSNAIPPKIFHAMERNIGTLHALMAQLNHNKLTYQDVLDVTAEKDHHQILRDAAKYAHVANSANWSNIQVPIRAESVSVNVRMRDHVAMIAPLAPRHPFWNNEAPEESKLKFIRACEDILDLSKRFGMLRHVLRFLRDNCTSGQQVRYALPSVLHLCKRSAANDDCDDLTEKWRERYAAFKPARQPPMSPELREAVRDAGALITMAAMLENVPERSEPVDISFINGIPPFEFEGQKIQRMYFYV